MDGDDLEFSLGPVRSRGAVEVFGLVWVCVGNGLVWVCVGNGCVCVGNGLVWSCAGAIRL